MGGMNGEVAYGAARAFAKKVAMGLTNVNVDNINKTITFTLVADGSQHTLQFDELSTAITSQIKSDVAIGNVTVGKVYPVGTQMEEILKDILAQYVLPSVRLDIQPSATLYDVVNDTVSEITMNATITKGTSEVSKVEFFVDDVLKKTVDTNVASGGLFEYVYRPDTPINANTVLKVVATDAKDGVATSTKTIKFVGKSYYGIVDASIGAPTEAIVKTLNGVLKDTKAYVYEGITSDWGKVCYAYPSSFGELTSIKDVVNNFNYTTSFTKTILTVDGIEYVCYTQTNASASNNIELTFA